VRALRRSIVFLANHHHCWRSSRADCPLPDIPAFLFVDGFPDAVFDIVQSVQLKRSMDSEASLAEGYQPSHGTPRWVKVFGIVVIILVLLFVSLHLVGGGVLSQYVGRAWRPRAALHRRGAWCATAMTMTPGLRKFALTTHVTSSVGLLGSIAAFLALAVAGLSNPNDQLARAAYPAMELIARIVIVPLAFAALLSGVIQSLGTAWGLFRPGGRGENSC